MREESTNYRQNKVTCQFSDGPWELTSRAGRTRRPRAGRSRPAPRGPEAEQARGGGPTRRQGVHPSPSPSRVAVSRDGSERRLASPRHLSAPRGVTLIAARSVFAAEASAEAVAGCRGLSAAAPRREADEGLRAGQRQRSRGRTGRGRFCSEMRAKKQATRPGAARGVHRRRLRTRHRLPARQAC